jgi:PAS domain S-box-containing protein
MPQQQPEADLAPAILEQAADAVIFADSAGEIHLWNAAACALFGFSKEEALGRSLDLIVPERLRAAHWTGFRRAIESGTTRLEGRATVTRSLSKSGKTLYVELSFALVKRPSGEVGGAVAIARDVTRRYEEERARRRAAGESPGSGPATPSVPRG